MITTSSFPPKKRTHRHFPFPLSSSKLTLHTPTTDTNQMCSKTTPGSFQDNRTHPMKTRRKTKSFSSTSSTSSSSSSKLARKTRTKTRKHKFISLRRDLDLSPSPAVSSPDSSATENHQLNLFPLHPENLYEEKEDNVTHFFETDGGGATTLNEFLWGGGGGGGGCAVSSEEDTLALSPATTLTYTYGGQDREECCGSLEKTALRHRDERDPSEEKWVCYSEVVEKKKVEVEVPEYSWKQNKTKRLSLKLDYQEIMNAWSDKGPLYIEGEGPQVVPDILDDAMAAHDNTNMMMDVGNVWKVPDDGSSVGVMEGGDPGEGWKVGNREARVLRYKEKRQSRLFSKRIRYEVRKLNAEKRPRMKGRFVKRS